MWPSEIRLFWTVLRNLWVWSTYNCPAIKKILLVLMKWTVFALWVPIQFLQFRVSFVSRLQFRVERVPTNYGAFDMAFGSSTMQLVFDRENYSCALSSRRPSFFPTQNWESLEYWWWRNRVAVAYSVSKGKSSGKKAACCGLSKGNAPQLLTSDQHADQLSITAIPQMLLISTTKKDSEQSNPYTFWKCYQFSCASPL